MDKNRFKILYIALAQGMVEVNGQVHYPAIECAEILGFTDPEQSVFDFCKTPKDESGSEILPELQEVLHKKPKYITENDLFRLIVRSKLSLAQDFEEWIFDQVLPAIRKIGVYVIADTFDNTIQRPAFLQELLLQMEQDFYSIDEIAMMEKE